jgi:hypothetical protein
MLIIAGVDPADPATDDFTQTNFSDLSASWEDFRIGFADREWYWEPLSSENRKPEQKVCTLMSSFRTANADSKR